jgi:hypothetical protein
MIKLKPEKSREAVIAYLFAFFSPSLSVASQKKTRSPSRVNLEIVRPSGVTKEYHSPCQKINSSSRANGTRTASTINATTNKTTGTNSSSIVTDKSSIMLWISRVKMNFNKKWSTISTTMAWNYQKMTKIYHFDNQSFCKHELKYTVIFFLYN